jgi:hypothetical protein
LKCDISMFLRRQGRSELEHGAQDITSLLQPGQVEDIWASPEPLPLVSSMLRVSEKYPPFRAEVVAEFFLQNISQCKRLSLEATKAANWVSILANSFYLDIKEDAVDALKRGLDSPLGDVFDETEAAALVDFLHKTYFDHFRLVRYCMKYEKKIETIESVIEMPSFEKTPPFKGAVPVSSDRARAAFRRASTLAIGGSLHKASGN